MCQPCFIVFQICFSTCYKINDSPPKQRWTLHCYARVGHIERFLPKVQTSLKIPFPPPLHYYVKLSSTEEIYAINYTFCLKSTCYFFPSSNDNNKTAKSAPIALFSRKLGPASRDFKIRHRYYYNKKCPFVAKSKASETLWEKNQLSQFSLLVEFGTNSDPLPFICVTQNVRLH